MAQNFHEHFERSEAPLPSDRSTGLVFTAVALLVACLWRKTGLVAYVALSAAAALGLVSLLAPHLLRPLNIAWMRLAHLLSRIVNPIVMGVLFAVVIVPAGLVMQRLADPLLRRRRPGAQSYWQERRGDARSSMTNQF
jgi:hypothetical protein